MFLVCCFVCFCAVVAPSTLSGMLDIVGEGPMCSGVKSIYFNHPSQGSSANIVMTKINLKKSKKIRAMSKAFKLIQ